MTHSSYLGLVMNQENKKSKKGPAEDHKQLNLNGKSALRAGGKATLGCTTHEKTGKHQQKESRENKAKVQDWKSALSKNLIKKKTQSFKKCGRRKAGQKRRSGMGIIKTNSQTPGI